MPSSSVLSLPSINISATLIWIWGVTEPNLANEKEIISLIDGKRVEDIIEFSKKIKKLIVVTRGEKGALAVNGDEVIECPAKKNLKIVDLTGAGDLFAGGFLHSLINGKNIKECLFKGTEMSSQIIQVIGARLK